tara:strand:+ start:1343 stop:1837 length:495 start_codon:yes stop_codon:yes gene_type:complete
MAIKDTSKKPYIIDRDSNVKVGIDLPIRFADEKEGGFATTKTTIDAVKNNIKNLLSTNYGERFMQPQLGTNLRKVLFEPINETTILQIQDIILDAFELWLPFVDVRDIRFTNNNKNTDDNQVRIKIEFSIRQDPTTTDSVTMAFSSDINEQSETRIGDSSGGGY